MKCVCILFLIPDFDYLFIYFSVSGDVMRRAALRHVDPAWRGRAPGTSPARRVVLAYATPHICSKPKPGMYKGRDGILPEFHVLYIYTLPVCMYDICTLVAVGRREPDEYRPDRAEGH